MMFGQIDHSTSDDIIVEFVFCVFNPISLYFVRFSPVRKLQNVLTYKKTFFKCKINSFLEHNLSILVQSSYGQDHMFTISHLHRDYKTLKQQ